MCWGLYLASLRGHAIYLQDACITSFADDTELTLFAKSVDDLILKANDAFKRFEVLTSLSLLCVNAKKTLFTDIL